MQSNDGKAQEETKKEIKSIQESIDFLFSKIG